jgi:hypothetical protein
MLSGVGGWPSGLRAASVRSGNVESASAEITDILNGGYATAISLPFRDEPTAASVLEAVRDLDHRFLLMSQHIKRLRIETPDLQRTIEIRRTVAREGIEEAVLVSTDGVRAVRQRWTKWSQQWESEDEDNV